MFGRMQGAQGASDMSWDQIVYNVIVPVGAALALGFGGIWAAKLLAGKLDKNWSGHPPRK